MKPTFVRNATPADALDIAHRLRPEDRAEAIAATGGDPRFLLPLAVQGGREVLVAGLQSNNRPEILFGVDPIPGVARAGLIWLLSTPEIYDHPVEFVMRTRELLDGFHERYDLLTNFMDERNTRHLKWLKWMGFKLIRRVECFGAQNLPFIEFASYRQCA